MSGATAGRTGAADANKGRVEVAKVKRYRPGQVPEWMQAPEEGTELPGLVKQADDAAARRTGVSAPVIVRKADDPRLRRLAEAAPVDRAAAARERHREVVAPAVVVRRGRERPGSDEEAEPALPSALEATQQEEADDAEAIAARREAMRQRLKSQEEAAAAAGGGGLEAGEEESEEESESEYETDSEDDLMGYRPLAKPVFVPRVSRETVAEREAMLAEEEQAAERQRERLEQRKEETKEILAARLAEEEAQAAAAAAGPKGAEDVDTDDDAADEEVEFEAWRLRELKRIATDREQREREVREAEERERWKAMSEEERAAFRPAAERDAKPKKSINFLQKYYHRGAFFQTEAEYKGEAAPLVGDAVQRDFSAPTGEDRVDKSMLPAVMQVKKFGRRGRTKWTHLVAEDTTDAAAPWAADEAVRRKFEARRAGTEQVFTKPKNMKT